jgi:chromosome partitioning protein
MGGRSEEADRGEGEALIIALAGQKGGCGKTTIAVQLAVEYQRQGCRVLLVDADPQISALDWAEIAAGHGHEAPCVVAMGDNLRQQLPAQAADYDVVLIDCPGHKASRRQTAALSVADLVVLPCCPTSFDIRALGASIDVVLEMQEMRPELKAAILINRKKMTAEGRVARDNVSGCGLPVLETTLGDRVAFSQACGGGQGVTLYEPNGAAAAEVRALVVELARLAIGGDSRG